MGLLNIIKDFFYKENSVKEQVIEKKEQNIDINPSIMKLTQEEIDDIHSRGKITPEEILAEWEGFDLCAPGDAIGSAAWRCEKFRNCRACLIDYANRKREHDSIIENLTIANSLELNDGGKQLILTKLDNQKIR